MPPAVTTYADQQPTLRLETYFEGKTRAWGIVQNRSGKVIRRFSGQFYGYWQDDKFILDEQFTDTDGDTDRRTWVVTRNGDNTYVATTNEVEGMARGEVSGNAMRWKYDFRVKTGGRELVLAFDDWMFALPGDVVINRATMHKFFFRVGELTLFMMKEEDS